MGRKCIDEWSGQCCRFVLGMRIAYSDFQIWR